MPDAGTSFTPRVALLPSLGPLSSSAPASRSDSSSFFAVLTPDLVFVVLNQSRLCPPLKHNTPQETCPNLLSSKISLGYLALVERLSRLSRPCVVRLVIRSPDPTGPCA